MNTLLETFPQKTAVAPLSHPPPAARRARILVVDDDLFMRESNARMLNRLGYEVDLANDGVDAWQALNDNRYDLLITDQQMPWVTGLELIQKLRSEAMTLPVILATGAVPTEELNRLPGLEIQAVVQKPCPLEKFLQTVNEVLAATGIVPPGAAPTPNGHPQP
jgi:CheY-like chemotaxis protein